MVDLNIAANYVPSPGTTVVASVIHRIIDGATVTAHGSADYVGPFDVVSSYSLAYPASIQFINNDGVKVGHATDMSLSPVLFDNLFSKGGISYYEPASAPSGARMIQRGMPAFIYPNPGPGALLLGKKDRLTGKNSPGGTITSLDGDARYRHVFPVVNGDLKCVEQSAVTISSCGLTVPTRFCPFVLSAQTTTAATLQPIEVTFKGPSEALVHASLSSTFNANDLYCMYFKAGTPYMNFPVSWNGSSVTAGERCHIPWGVIREVHTSSGVTNVVNHRVNDSYSLAAQPYYVADIWFWGEPCL
jgi:hypothetical protein